MNTNEELESIIRELKSIIRELEELALQIESEFNGIGEEKCAAAIHKNIFKYKKTLSKLEKVNPSLVVEGFEVLKGAF